MSKAIKAQSVSALLRGNSLLSALRQTARRHQGGQQEITGLLPPALADKVRLIRDEARLIALAENGAVAQMVRFHAGNLQRQTGLKVEVRVRPTGSAPRQPVTPAPILPGEAAGCLNQAADAVADDDLAASLRRLASRAGE
jgi:hypothetical protein